MAVAFEMGMNPVAISAIQGSTNINASYPATELMQQDEPRRTTRSSSTGATNIVLDFGAGHAAIEAFSVENYNFGSLLIERATTVGSWTTVGTYTTTGSDKDDGRRKRVMTGFTAITDRYIRLTPSSADAGATYFELGFIAAWGEWRALAKNFGVPYDKPKLQDVESLRYPGGRRETGAPTPVTLQLRLVLSYSPSNTAAETDAADLSNYPKNRILAIWEGGSDVTKVYHCKPSEDAEPAISRTNQGHRQLTGLVLDELT